MKFLLLVLVTVGLALSPIRVAGSASPASEMEAHLNSMESQLMEDPVARDLEENAVLTQSAYEKGVEVALFFSSRHCIIV